MIDSDWHGRKGLPPKGGNLRQFFPGVGHTWHDRPGRELFARARLARLGALACGRGEILVGRGWRRADAGLMSEWILAMETCVPRASLVLAQDGEVLVQAEFESERSQEVDLFEPLEQVLLSLPEEEKLDGVLVGTGPGSYNGARVGIAAAQAVAQVNDAWVAGRCSFEGVAEVETGSALAVGDARRGGFFTLPLEEGRVAGEVALHEAETFQEKLVGFSGKLVTFESVARLSLPENLAARVRLVEPGAAGLLARWLGRSVEEREALKGGVIEAFYLRTPHITKGKK